MKEFALLFKLQLKNNFRSRERSAKKRLAEPLIVGFAMLPIIGILCFAIYMLAQSSARSGVLAELFVLIMSSTQVLTLFFVSKVYISTFYNADDNEFLATLPVSPLAKFLSKLAVVYISELAFTAFLLLPTQITAAVSLGVSGYPAPWTFYIFIPLSVLFAPIAPLFIISIFAAPIMYLASFFKRRAAMSSIMSIVLFVGLMGAYFMLVPNFAYIAELQNDLPAQAVAIFKRIGNVLYFDKTFYLAALNVEFAKNFFITAGILAGAFLVSSVLTLALFNRSVTAQFETHSKNKEARFDYKSQSTVRALLANDFKSLLRTPGLAMNSFMSIFMAPLLLIAMGIFMKGEEAQAFDSQMMKLSFCMLYGLMLNAGMNYVAMLSFTREGKTFYFLKHLPVSCRDILKAKRAFADIVSAIGIVLFMVVAMIVYKFNPIVLLAMGLILFAFSAALNTLGIYRDMKRPHLEWNNINEAMRRNYYIMLPFFIAMGLGFASMGLGTLLSSATAYIHEYWVILIYCAGLLAVAVVFYILVRKLLLSKQEELFEKIGEVKFENYKSASPRTNNSGINNRFRF
jgi:hypothetical protein